MSAACRSPEEAIAVVRKYLVFFADGPAVPRWSVHCLLRLKLALQLIALSTGATHDIQYSNFGVACGPVWCKVPPAILEILEYMDSRLAEKDIKTAGGG